MRDAGETKDERPPERNKLRANGDDDTEKEILGLASEVEEDGDADEDLDDVELLGLGGDEAEEDFNGG